MTLCILSPHWVPHHPLLMLSYLDFCSHYCVRIAPHSLPHIHRYLYVWLHTSSPIFAYEHWCLYCVSCHLHTSCHVYVSCKHPHNMLLSQIISIVNVYCATHCIIIIHDISCMCHVTHMHHIRYLHCAAYTCHVLVLSSWHSPPLGEFNIFFKREVIYYSSWSSNCHKWFFGR